MKTGQCAEARTSKARLSLNTPVCVPSSVARTIQSAADLSRAAQDLLGDLAEDDFDACGAGELLSVGYELMERFPGPVDDTAGVDVLLCFGSEYMHEGDIGIVFCGDFEG